MMRAIRTIVGLILGLYLSVSYTQTNLNANQQKQINTFINNMVAKHHYNRAHLVRLLRHAEFNAAVIATMTRPYEGRPWEVYRDFFITPKRIQQGVQFWLQNQKALNQMQQRYGVPPNVIVAILGIETNYGQVLGKYNTLNTLYTLAFNYPPRSKFFESELEHFLLLCYEQNLNPLTITGSYAGAIGLPQFMPSSYRFYAVDGDDSKHIDLVHDKADAIASIANYLSKSGWQPNQLVAVRARVRGWSYNQLAVNKLKPTISIKELNKFGVRPIINLPPEQLATFIRLQAENAPDYWLGLHNFYVISRYNPQLSYTMVVYMLSEEIKIAMAHNNRKYD